MTAVELLSLPSNEPVNPIPALLLIDCFPCVVGRHSGSDRRLNDPAISRRHCTFTQREDRVWVEDLGSLNGTRLNGKPLEGAQPVTDGDLLELAHLRFQVRLATEAGDEVIDLGALEPGPESSTRPKLA